MAKRFFPRFITVMCFLILVTSSAVPEHYDCSTCSVYCSKDECKNSACCKVFDESTLAELNVVADCAHPNQSYVLGEPASEPVSQLHTHLNITDLSTAATESPVQMRSQLCGGFSLAVYYRYRCLTALPNNLCNFTDVRRITFVGEKLAEFPDLSCLQRLVILDLRDNQLTSVPQDAFAGLSMLEEVYLDNNQIHFIHPAAFDVSLPYLRVFSVTHNLLKTVEPWILNMHHPFCKFDFSYNHINDFTNKNNFKLNFSETYGPGFLSFTYNNMTQSPTNFIIKYGFKPLMWSKFLKWGFDFRGNPFHCDCTFFAIVKWLNTLRKVLWRDYFNITCAAPPKYQGVSVFDLPVNELVCPVSANCPQNCTCDQRPEIRDTIVNCTSAGLSELPFVMPDASRLTLQLSDNNLATVPPRKYLAQTIHLDLRGNSIEMIDEEVPRRLMKSELQSVDLRNNSLRHLPYTVQVLPPDSVFLDPDTLSCTCDLKWFPLWAQLSNSTRYQRLFCLTASGHKVLLRNATEDDLGCNMEEPDTSVYKVCLISVAGVLVVTMVVVAVFRYELLVLTHAITGWMKRASRRSTSSLRHYDVFLSMSVESEADLAWVSVSLLPALGDHDLKVFWPARDCVPGIPELEQVTKKLQDSASALVVLSEDYVTSPACVFQFFLIYNQMVMHGQGRLILLQRDAITRKKITDPRLRAMVALRMAHSASRTDDLLKIVAKLKADLSSRRSANHDATNRI